MFNFSSKTKVDKAFKLNELFKLMHADKGLKEKSQNILSVQMINALSETTTGLKSSKEVNEIYILKIELSNDILPYDFLKSLNKTIQFQVVYELCYNNKVKYVTGYKNIDDGTISVHRFVESEWISYNTVAVPLVSSLLELYKAMLTKIVGLEFRESEQIKDWLSRLSEIEKLQKEFKRIEKLMDSEIQPKRKFEYNEKLREIYDSIKELKA